MSHFDQNLKITKDKEEELYFKVYAQYVNNEIIENATCLLLEGTSIIKEVKPIEIQENGVFFMLGKDIPKGEYTYKIIGRINGGDKALLDRREVEII
ncbi:hypothetical protein [Pseudomonas sp.]|uniref:hypothetical protein n=1 Tax=Pseudomonas sp. TaxID=306 RepID=UPI003FD83E97